MRIQALPYIHHRTPTLSVSDPRGLPLRTVRFYRRQASDALESYVSAQGFDAAGRLASRRDPYLYGLAAIDPDAPNNLTQVLSLAGVTLLTDSVDSGWHLALPGPAGPVMEQWDARGSHSLARYDALQRPVTVQEEGLDVALHVIERFTYASATEDAITHNLSGTLIRHDDPAGTLHVEARGLGGAISQQTRHFLSSIAAPHWPANVTERDALLEPSEGAVTSHQYSPTNDLLQQIDVKGNCQYFTYNLCAELKTVGLMLAGASQAQQPLIRDTRYNAFGQPETQTAGNGVISHYRHDAANGRLVGLSAHKPRGLVLQDLIYTYDPVGNVSSIKDAAQATRYFANQQIEPLRTYRYDTLYQLIEATGWEFKATQTGPVPVYQPLPLDPNQIGHYTQTYHYDAGGNLLDLEHIGAQAHSRILTRDKYSNRCLPERGASPTPPR